MTEKIKKEKTAKDTSGNKNLKQILISIGIILLATILISCGVCYYLATRTVLPEAPETYTSEDELYNTISKGILRGRTTSLDNDDLNGALEIAKTSVNEKLEQQDWDIKVNQLFGTLNDNMLTCYMNISKGKTSFDLTFTAEIDYSYPEAYIYVSSMKIGELDIPVKAFMKKLSSYPMPDNITINGRRFVYDSSELNDTLIEMIKGNETVNNVEDLVDNIFSFFGVKVDTDDVVDNFLNDHVEFKLTDIKIDGSKIKIESDLFK